MKQATTIDEYIANFPAEVRVTLQKIRQTIQEAAPEASEKISYGIPTFVQHGNLIHFAAYEKHYGIYPGAAPIEEFKERLKVFSTSKGTIQLPIEKPLPYKLISDITKACVERNMAKKK